MCLIAFVGSIPKTTIFSRSFKKKLQLISKIDTNATEKVGLWLHELTGEEIFDLEDWLRSGVTLCKVINAIKPGMIPRYNERPIAIMELGSFREANTDKFINFFLKKCISTDNIKMYLEACERLVLFFLKMKKKINQILNKK